MLYSLLFGCFAVLLLLSDTESRQIIQVQSKKGAVDRNVHNHHNNREHHDLNNHEHHDLNNHEHHDLNNHEHHDLNNHEHHDLNNHEHQDLNNHEHHDLNNHEHHDLNNHEHHDLNNHEHHDLNNHEHHDLNKHHGSEHMRKHRPTHEEEQLDSLKSVTDNQAGTDVRVDDDTEIEKTPSKHNKQTRLQRKKHKKMKLAKSKARARESAWYYCADESIPKEVKISTSSKGVMCSKEYPAHTCCFHHDLTMELIGSQIAEQIPDAKCAHFLIKLRCAHCSPRSWWLFHAPDKHRHPHKRVMPILCPAFCKKFHSACRDSIQGLQNDNFCEFHTSNEAGPCFPDYEIRQGTID